MPDRRATLNLKMKSWTPDSKYHMLMHMKRTTLLLDPGLYGELKRRAATEGRTLTEIVEQALRLGLAAAGARRRGRVTLPSYDLGPFLVAPAEHPGFAAPVAESHPPTPPPHGPGPR
jgi:hypothetical protein